MRQVLLAASFGLIITLFGTPVAIRALVRQGYGQLIRDDGPTSHHTKRGTPTMGGAVIIAGTLIGYFGAHLLTWSETTVSGLLVLFLMTGLGLVGFLDDYIKVAKQRSLGLRAWAKLGGQSLVAVTFAVLAVNFPDRSGFTPASTEISFIRDTGLGLGAVLFVGWAYLMIAGTSNGVNLTDGLDGLAAGCCAIVLLAFTAMCFITAGPGQTDLALLSACLVGACVGFLWFNSFPASVFMGDTGSLGLGGAIAGLAVMTKTEVLLLLIGGIFVIEALSVLIQVFAFQRFRRRVFLMAPIHHHFEMMAWSETKIILRFWIVAAICSAIGFTLYQQSIA
ncbi:MAG TPA: phospho-N-acetylmuramoyl-pentapeptide-transferase [Actinomycetes bacterium]|nr:phospho-N-acetylmuramoyl-pentapeptide-transferase [Actinomycetes bacterium]